MNTYYINTVQGASLKNKILAIDFLCILLKPKLFICFQKNREKVLLFIFFYFLSLEKTI